MAIGSSVSPAFYQVKDNSMVEPRSSPSLLVIAGDAPATLYAVHRLFDVYPASRWLMPDWNATHLSKPEGNQAKRPILTRLTRVLRSRLLAHVIHRRNLRIQQHLPFPDAFRQRSPEMVLNAHEFNLPTSWERVLPWRPDLIVTAGAPILNDSWLTMTPLGCINVHFGIAPDYRGEHTLFFPLLERRFDQLGLTIHLLDRGIDKGPILAHVYPALDGSEDEAALWAKCSLLAARVLPEVVEAVWNKRARPIQQPTQGRLIRYIDRTMWHEVRSRVFRFRPPARPERVHLYQADSSL